MLGNSFLPENRIGVHFRGVGRLALSEHEEVTVEKLPFELFLNADKGDFCLLVDGKETVCHAGETVFLPCDTDFCLSSCGGCEFLFVGADYRIFTSFRILSTYSLPTLLSDEEFSLLCRRVFDTAEDNAFTNSRLENAVLVKTALLRLAERLISLGVPLSEGASLDRLLRISPVLSHIGDCLGLPMEMEELSRIMGLDEGSFYRFFRSVIGEAPRDYLLTERFRNARLMLLETEESIIAVSERCGYESPFSFSTLFHGRFGVSPSGYRKKMRSLFS